MSTSKRHYTLKTFESRILKGLFFAIVINAEHTRNVHETGMFHNRYFAKQAAKEWAETSQSKLAKSLERKGG